MTIINFPGGGSKRDDGEIERALALKRRLVDFVTRGPMREVHAREMLDTGLDEPEFHEFVDFTDWFIFEWESEEGTCVLDEFLAAEMELADAERRMLESWYDAVDDVFQVVSVQTDGVTLRDGEALTYFAVPTESTPHELGWRANSLVHTRLVPVGSIYLLSGIQSFYEGSDLEDLPSGIDLAAFGHAFDATTSGYDAAAIADVDALSSDERPPGSVAEAAAAFLDEASARLKPDALQRHRTAVGLFTHYASEASLRADEIAAEDLFDFLAVWYPRVASDRSFGATRALLSSIGKFATWIGRRHKTDVGTDYRSRVFAELRDDLPRTIKAAGEFDRPSSAHGVLHVVEPLAEPEPSTRAFVHDRGEPYRARYAIVAMQGNALTLRERSVETEAIAPLNVADVPHAVATLLRPGDVLEGTFVAAPGSRVVVRALDCVFCPAAGL